jgi:ElaB/YqjD/DUF883 family membrane-anchored ribosome-binding protein
MAKTEATEHLEKSAKDTANSAAETIHAAKDVAGEAAADVKDHAKARFAQALDEAKASVSALGKMAQEQTEAYREKLAAADLTHSAKELAADAAGRAAALATDGKSKASDLLTSLGKVVADNAGVVNDKLGEKYGDYARGAARSIQETAAKLESKDFTELGEDAKGFVRARPFVALGIAAVAGFLVARALTPTASTDTEA